jgi:carbon-monoxide dehydrogenase large subunit
MATALVDALSVLGIRHVEMPATPERLWRAMRDAAGQHPKTNIASPDFV